MTTIVRAIVEAADEPDLVEFDPYVPVTVRWSAAFTLGQRPTYRRARSDVGLVELKFHPASGELIELVVVSVRHWRSSESLWTFVSDPEGGFPACTTDPQELGLLSAVAHPNAMLVQFGLADVRSWTSSGPISFGWGLDDSLVAFSAAWTTAERGRVLPSAS